MAKILAKSIVPKAPRITAIPRIKPKSPMRLTMNALRLPKLADS